MNIHIGVSACLLGQMCRYNGEHAREHFVSDVLAKYFNYVPFCPEMVLGAPRAAIRQVQRDSTIKLLSTKGENDFTEVIVHACEDAVDCFEEATLSGFILKSKSPTCGLERVKVYSDANINGAKQGVGLFAKEIQKRYPYLPLEEEGRLQDPWLRENFLMQVYAYAAMQACQREAKSFKDIVSFHTRYKYLIYAKSHEAYKTLGGIVANHAKKDFEEVLSVYTEHFYQTIALKSTKANNYNIMQHIYGYFKDKVSIEEKRELLQAMQEYKEGILPMIVIVKMLRLYIEKFDVTYLKSQVFLSPYPERLGLRSDVRSYK